MLEPFATPTFMCLIMALVFNRLVERADGASWVAPGLFSELLRWFVPASLYGAIFLLTWRPITSLFVFMCAALGLLIANRLKKRVVYEPITFSDLGLLGQIVRHPKLYYLDNPLVVGPPIILLIGGLTVAFLLEPPITPWLPCYVLALTVWVGLFVARGKIGQDYAPLVLSEAEGWGSRHLGLMSAIVVQLLGWTAGLRDVQPQKRFAADLTLEEVDVVVIQLESFADLTAHVDGYQSGWHQLQLMSRYYGQLRVPARGANTMRTEHAVLSGVSNTSLKFDRFDPYLRRLAGQRGYFGQLKTLGWRTVFLHPNDLSFFRRDNALASFGFEVLIGRDRFQYDVPVGPYVGDQAVVREIIHELKQTQTPTALFAVTMENHGPWKANRLPGVAGGLASYMAHQRNTDLALTELIEQLRDSSRRTLLVLYGDHLPALPQLHATSSSNTDYVVIDTAQSFAHTPQQREVSAEDLLDLALSVISEDTNQFV